MDKKYKLIEDYKLKRLVEESLILTELETWGVDNWTGYDVCHFPDEETIEKKCAAIAKPAEESSPQPPLSKKFFCLIVNALKEDFKREINLYQDLKKYDIYLEIEKHPLVSALEKIIKDTFYKGLDADFIFESIYPIVGEEEDAITPEELYDEIIKNYI